MRQFTKIEKEAPIDFENFRIHMQREMILRKLKEGGYRITKQRIAVIDIILENDCGSCKEILYKTSKINGIPHAEYAGGNRCHQPQKSL